MAAPARQNIGKFEVVELLAQGGMGVVYKAIDTQSGRTVALKILPEELSRNPLRVARFLREAKAASALNHPNIVTIYEAGRHGAIDYIAMEFVSGRTMEDWLHDGPPTLDRALDWAIQTATAVSKAHEVGVVHRDLKPANLMINDDGLVKVLDFGLASLHLAEEDEDATQTIQLTQPGMVMGTAAYMSPEQAAGEAVDARSDVFSLGVILYEMLAGRPPFRGTSMHATLRRVQTVDPEPLRKLRPDVPSALAALIDKALGKEKEQRWQTMQEMRAALLAVGQQLAAAGGQTTLLLPAELGAPPRKRRLPVLGVTAVVAVSLAALGVSWLWHWSFEPARTGRKDVVVGVGGAHEAVRTARALLSRYDRDANLDKAIALLEQSLAASPVHAPTHAALVMAYYFKGGATREEHWRRRALDAANRAVELDGQLAQSHVALGLVRALSGDAQSARLAFERALELDPRSVDGHWHLGRMGLAAKDWDRARASLSAAIKLDPSHWAAYTSLGTLHYQRGELDQAGAAWDRARQIAPDNVIVLRNLVALYDKLGRYEEAAAVIQAALEVQPSPGLYSNLGVLQFYEGRYGLAVEAFEKAIKSGSNNFRTWGNLADAQRWSPPHKAKAPESYGVAVGLVEKELARAPEDDSARASLAVYLAKLGRKQDALAQAGKVRSELPGIRFKLAIVRELSGDRAGALQALEEALRVHHPLREIEREPELIALRADPRYQKLFLGKR